MISVRGVSTCCGPLTTTSDGVVAVGGHMLPGAMRISVIDDCGDIAPMGGLGHSLVAESTSSGM